MIEEPVRYITKVEISGLWDRYDIEWSLNKDVNVLAGINGSGKTTILKYIYHIVSEGSVPKLSSIENIKIFFDNEHDIFAKKILVQDTIKNIEDKANTGDIRSKIIMEYFNGKHAQSTPVLFIGYEVTLQPGMTFDSFEKTVNIKIINTFDFELKTQEAVQKLSDDRVKSDLDWELYQLQEKYKDYQINTARKKESVFKDNQGNPFMDNIVIEFRRLSYSRERLLDIIDELFSETDKKVNRDKNELEFLLGDKEINAYQLSSGEKQLLVILLNVLVQDNKPSILLMDEPEISLHIEWQRKLIKYIRELNPNAQIIIATHSPAIIMEGWLDKVFNLEDLIVKDSIDATV
jgi:predicted ATP-dependent endonuclease of OLD family